jgi:hypothetical protein
MDSENRQAQPAAVPAPSSTAVAASSSTAVAASSSTAVPASSTAVAAYAAAGPQPVAVAARCRGLRYKGMFIDSPPDPTIPNPHDGFFWCGHTLTCLGPDRQVVDEHGCGPDRSCYEAL